MKPIISYYLVCLTVLGAIFPFCSGTNVLIPNNIYLSINVKVNNPFKRSKNETMLCMS